MDRGKKWLVDFNAGKTELVLFDRSNNSGFIDVKIDGSVLGEKSSFKRLGVDLFEIGLRVLHYLLCYNCLQENWSINYFYDVSLA